MRMLLALRDHPSELASCRSDHNPARFVGNTHIVLPSKRDYAVVYPQKQPTFPEPLPNYLTRNNAIPPAVLPGREPSSANAGRFSMGLKGMRRELRKSGPRTEQLVRELEDEILAWLDGGVMLAPDTATEMSFPGRTVDSSETVKEVNRTPLQLVWSIEDNAWTRYVVHCCARYHEVVSFSVSLLPTLPRPCLTLLRRQGHLWSASHLSPPAKCHSPDTRCALWPRHAPHHRFGLFSTLRLRCRVCLRCILRSSF